jgi:hypothetical protein
MTRSDLRGLYSGCNSLELRSCEIRSLGFGGSRLRNRKVKAAEEEDNDNKEN